MILMQAFCNTCSDFYTEKTVDKVKSKLKELNSYKSAGVDRLLPRILKKLSKKLSIPLSGFILSTFLGLFQGNNTQS